MNAGRTVRLFLVDGTPTGLITAEIMNWTGHVLVGPRSRLADVLRRQEVARTGVYFLVGDDPEMPSKALVYVGETDDFGERIRSHNSDVTKEFWTRLCVVTSKDQNLTKAHVRYLENRLVQITKDAGRANLANGNQPGGASLPESDIADMEYFLGQIEVVLPTVGFDFLRKQPGASVREATKLVETSPVEATKRLDVSQPLESSERRFPLTGHMVLTLAAPRLGIKADAIEADGEITVLQGSTAQKADDYQQNSYKPLREQLIQEGRLRPTEDGKNMMFATDVTFKSPSAASAVIFNRNDNGRKSWRIKDTGETLGDWQDAQAEAAAARNASVAVPAV